jgi:hypothetical protein
VLNHPAANQPAEAIMLSNQTVTRDEFLGIVSSWFEALGTKPENAVSMEVGHGGIKIVVYRTNDYGQRIVNMLGTYIQDTYNIAVKHADSCDDPNALCNPRIPVEDGRGQDGDK